jgi:tetratricopeptide (TPR) repeat protein
LQQAAALSPTGHVYSQIGQVYGASGRWPEALAALDQAQKLDPAYAMTYFYRGLVYYNLKQCDQAVEQYKHAMALDSTVPELSLALRQASACAGH